MCGYIYIYIYTHKLLTRIAPTLRRPGREPPVRGRSPPYIILYYTILYYIILYYVILYHIMLCHIIVLHSIV